VPSFNVRHLKRASELLGFLMNRGYPGKDALRKSLKYAVVDTQEQSRRRIRELLLTRIDDIKKTFPDFTESDMPQEFHRAALQADAPVSTIPHDFPSILDILRKNNKDQKIEKALALLREVIDSSDTAFVSIPGLEAAFRVIDDELIREITIEELERKLEDKSWAVRQPAALALGRVYLAEIRQGKEVELSVLAEGLNDEDPSVARAAAQALSRIWHYEYKKKKITLAELERRLGDENWAVRHAAARTLGRIYPSMIAEGMEVDAGKLEEGLWNKNWFVRQAEAEALGQTYPAFARKGIEINIEGLEAHLKDKNVLSRQTASLALGLTYPALIKRGKDVNLEKIEERLDDDDWSVRQAAAVAVGRIWFHSYFHGRMALKEIEKRIEDPS
jgi:HEAT repeat protein